MRLFFIQDSETGAYKSDHFLEDRRDRIVVPSSSPSETSDVRDLFGSSPMTCSCQDVGYVPTYTKDIVVPRE